MPTSDLTPTNSAIVMIDHAIGWANLFRSHDVAAHVNNTVALAKTAITFDMPLILTNGADSDPAGPLLPELKEVIGDTPVIVREGNFDAFLTPEFSTAVEATGRRKLVMSGVMTEGCLLLTALSALRSGYEVFVVVDASAGETLETHHAAVQRLIQAGTIPVTWLSLAAEYQVSWANLDTVNAFRELVTTHSPTLGTYMHTYAATLQYVDAAG